MLLNIKFTLILIVVFFFFNEVKSQNLNNISKKESSTNDYIGLYQTYVSSIRGQECPMYPSCSNFGMKTFGEINFASAFVLTSDRLLRCGHDFKNYSITLRPIGFKSLDYPAYDQAPGSLYYERNSFHFAFADTTEINKFPFIIKLINSQYYREALLEIKREEGYQSKVSNELFINKIICLKALEEYEMALLEFDKCPQLLKTNSELLYQMAYINYKLKNFDVALKLSDEALNFSNDLHTKSKIILLDGLLHANKFEWTKSMNSYKLLSSYESYKKISNANYELSHKASNLRPKNTALAGIISVIPGAGYAYAGHKQTAISAFVVNSLLAYATYTSFKTKNYGIGALTGVFNISFYLGNIYGAVKSTKRYNENRKQLIINKLKFNSNL